MKLVRISFFLMTFLIVPQLFAMREALHNSNKSEEALDEFIADVIPKFIENDGDLINVLIFLSHEKNRAIINNEDAREKIQSALEKALQVVDETTIKKVNRERAIIKPLKLMMSSIDRHRKLTIESFIHAINTKNYALVEKLLKSGYNPNLRLTNQRNLENLLAMAIQRNDVKMVKLLLNYGVDSNRPLFVGNIKELPLERALKNGKYDVAIYLLKQGAKPPKAVSKELLLSYMNHNVTPRRAYKIQKLLKLLIKKGMDPNHPLFINDTVPLLWHVIYKKDLVLLRFLLGQGANPRKTYAGNKNAIDFALHNGASDDVIDLLKRWIPFDSSGRIVHELGHE